MIVKVEQFQDKAYILDDNGRIWRFKLNFAGEPEVALLTKWLSHERINAVCQPQLARFDGELT
jgi:hypothetical protein